jgi:K+-transporting ATPase ATPase C chain
MGVKQLTDAYRRENDLSSDQLVPVDAVTRSASGLDPDITVQNALRQTARVARARKVPESAVIDLVKRQTAAREFGCLGEPRVNVLLLNLSLDEAKN